MVPDGTWRWRNTAPILDSVQKMSSPQMPGMEQSVPGISAVGPFSCDCGSSPLWFGRSGTDPGKHAQGALFYQISGTPPVPPLRGRIAEVSRRPALESITDKGTRPVRPAAPIPRDAYSAPAPGRLAANLSLCGSSQSEALPASLIVDKQRTKAARRICADGTGVSPQTDRCGSIERR